MLIFGYRREGVATAMYRFAEELTEKKLVKSPSQTPDSISLWKQPNRPFGTRSGHPQKIKE